MNKKLSDFTANVSSPKCEGKRKLGKTKRVFDITQLREALIKDLSSYELTDATIPLNRIYLRRQNKSILMQLVGENLENNDGMFEIESSFPTVISTKYQQQTSEPIVQMCSVKEVFSKVSQNSQENTYPRVSILKKLQVLNNKKTKAMTVYQKSGTRDPGLSTWDPSNGNQNPELIGRTRDLEPLLGTHT